MLWPRRCIPGSKLRVTLNPKPQTLNPRQELVSLCRRGRVRGVAPTSLTGTA